MDLSAWLSKWLLASIHTVLTDVTLAPCSYSARLTPTRFEALLGGGRLHPVAWLWLILRAPCGNWTKIRFSDSNLFEKDAREKLQLAARDGTVMGQDRSIGVRSFSAQLCSVPSNSILPPLISECKLRKMKSASRLLGIDDIHSVWHLAVAVVYI